MIRRVPRAVGRWLALVVLFASCNVSAADPAKVLRVALPRAETGFDPAMASEIYSLAVIAAIMEPLLTFDYLARPVKVIPLTAAALPEITDNGKTYTFRIRPGIFFADDPAFKGKRRELTQMTTSMRSSASSIRRCARPTRSTSPGRSSDSTRSRRRRPGPARNSITARRSPGSR